RDRYDEEVQRAGAKFQTELSGLEERRGDALRRLTDAHRKILDFSPYRAIRARYEEVSSVELIPAVRDRDPIPERYRRVKEEIETTLLGADAGGAVEDIREQLQKAPQEYEARYQEILEKYKQTCAEEHELVVGAGGLHILGTERHEARRIDNQLRGRGGRQGDPGSSRFYLSLEDDLLRIFGADRMQNMMERLGMEEGVPIEHRLITRAIRNAQEKVEAHHFDIRKHLLEYDDVLNKQREVIYARRRDLLSRDDLKEDVLEMAEGLAESLVATHADADTAAEEWEWKALDDAAF